MAMRDSHIYESSWIVSFKYTFGAEQQYAWAYNLDEADTWLGKTSDLLKETTGSGWIALSKRAKSPTFRDITAELRDEDNAKLVEDHDSFFSWIAPAENQQNPLQDSGVSTLLNHIVMSQSTKALISIISIVDRHRMTEIRGLKPSQPNWFYTLNSDAPMWRSLLGNHLLSFPELFASRDRKGKLNVKSYSDIENTLKAHRQRNVISVCKYEENDRSCTLRIRLDASLCNYKRGTLCNCIPIPGKPVKRKSDDPKEPIGVCSPEVVISSPVVENALGSLSDIWQDKAHAILVSGPPGSGKENFALSIPYGSGRKSNDNERIPTISLANGTPEQQEKQIFGYQQTDGSIEDGMLAKAKGSAIFIDEAHYPLDGPGVRSSLLRALEAKEYYPVDSLVLRRVDDVQWVFASSLPLDGSERSLSDVPPDDFWTRMTHQVRIEHPLDMKAYLHNGIKGFDLISKRQENVLRDLFKFFWWDRTKDHFGIDPARVFREEKADDLRGGDSSDKLAQSFVKVLLKETALNEIAGVFAKGLMTTVESQSLTEVSVRGLRSMVSHIFSKCVGYVTSGIYDKYGLVFTYDGVIKEELAKHLKKMAEYRKRIAENEKKGGKGWGKRAADMRKQRTEYQNERKRYLKEINESYCREISEVNEEILKMIRKIQQIARLKPEGYGRKKNEL